MSLGELEDFTIAAYYAGRRWLAPRITIPPWVVLRSRGRAQGLGLAGLHLLSHHWLVTVNIDGQVNLLDLSGPAQSYASRPHWTISLPEREGGYHSSISKLSEDGDHAIIAVASFNRFELLESVTFTPV